MESFYLREDFISQRPPKGASTIEIEMKASSGKTLKDDSQGKVSK
jgi:hypothetical protein